MGNDELKRLFQEVQGCQIEQLNRMMALEAMFDAILTRVDPKVLPVVAEAYETAKDRLAASIPPPLQRPDAWNQWSERIEALAKSASVKSP
jgi:hypothetical protein